MLWHIDIQPLKIQPQPQHQIVPLSANTSSNLALTTFSQSKQGYTYKEIPEQLIYGFFLATEIWINSTPGETICIGCSALNIDGFRISTCN